MLNIILVSKHLRAPKKFNLHDRRTAVVFGGVALAVLAMVFAMGMAASHAVGGLQLSHLQQRVAEQDRQLAEIKAENQRDMNAMALRLAEL
ncbi:MAG: hypothetical protein ACO25T_10350, partial [Arenimonas sp.]|uniref:hypothetical protein n=1 Tax=Arenimonas sp. TaxID=1872635 RepID=UPI003C04B6F7